MDQPTTFYPPRRIGLAFQGVICAALLALAAYLFYSGFQRQAGVTLILYILGALACFLPLAVFLYRLYSLLTARYQLERDGLRLRWGWRAEDIPFNQVDWIRIGAEVAGLAKGSLPLPFLRWPGALLGVRHAGGLGEMEYMASQARGLVLIATPGKVYAISPADPGAFIAAFDRLTELGSLAPLKSLSVYPTFLAGRVWQDKLARILLLTALALGLALLVWTVLVIRSHPAISLGFSRGSIREEPGPSERLLLLPVLEGLSFLGSLGLGLFFFRRPGQRAVAYLLWAGCAVEAVLLLAALASLSGV